jgi:hypothetical protein
LLKLTLLARAYCHLCDEMRLQIEPMLDDPQVTLEVLDVDADPALEARWGDKVPVLLADARELCRYRLDRAVLARWLREASTEVATVRKIG